MYYKEHGITDFEEVYSFLDNIDFSKKDPEIYKLLQPVLELKREKDKYNIKEYMKKNWNK